MNDGLSDGSEESSANHRDLRLFLANEFRQLGLAVDARQPAGGRDFGDWTLSRDEFGFIVTVDGDVESELSDYLALFLDDPKFHHDRTRIYRDDDLKLSVMLNGPAPTGERCDSTQLIVLSYGDPTIEQQISNHCEQAIEKLFEDAMAEIHELMEELQHETDEARAAELMKSAEAKLADIDEALGTRWRELGIEEEIEEGEEEDGPEDRTG